MIDEIFEFLETHPRKKLIYGVLIFAVLALCLYFFKSYRCKASWTDAEYGPIVGCIVITPQGKIPEDRIKMINWTYDGV